MSKRELMEGSTAIAEAAALVGCKFYASYPIQPNTHLLEQMSRVLSKVPGGVCMNAESELEAINMVWGAAATGNRAMCSSTSNGISLMQESMAEMFHAETPYVFVHQARGQTEYRQSTRGGGHSEYRYITFAPHTVQEAADLTQEAFHLADKLRTPVLVYSDYVLTHTVEAVEIRKPTETELRDKPWAITGAKGRKARIMSFISGTHTLGEKLDSYGQLLEKSESRIAELEKAVQPRAETGHLDDSELVVVAFGYAARFVKYAVELARKEGMKVGYVRPITLWPFPNDTMREAAKKAKAIAVFETNAGQMVDDVRLAVLGRAPVHFIGRVSFDDSGFGIGDAIEIPNIMAKIKEVYGTLREPAGQRRATRDAVKGKSA